MGFYSENSLKRISYIILALIFLSDLAYSFRQHYATPLDGDIVESVLPLANFQKVLDNPLGLRLILDNEPYPNPNRFFMHWPMNQFMGKMPLVFHHFFDPVQSVYLSVGLAKTMMQLVIILILAVIINGGFRPLTVDFVLSCVILSILFQTHGYRVKIGIIDRSITYAFSYALPLIYFLIFYLPLFIWGVHKKLQDLPSWLFLALFPIGIVVCLSGALNPAIVLVMTLVIIIALLKSIKRNDLRNSISQSIKTKKPIFKILLFYLFPVCLIAVYSLILGQYNSNQNLYPYSLFDSYKELPVGLFKYFTSKIAIPILILAISLNGFLIKKYSKDSIGLAIWSFAPWFLLFTIIYLVLLPLGGYRDYRPHIVRYDTLLPITIGIFILFGSTTISVIKTFNGSRKAVYASFVVLILSVFAFADKPKFNEHSKEMNALYQIANSTLDTVPLDSPVSVLSWKPILNPSDSKWNAELLCRWRITKTPKLYYSQQE